MAKNTVMKTEKPIKIILCDDHSFFRTGVRNSLARFTDVEVIGEAENGQVLIDLLETLQPDIILLNIQMPVLNGVETLPIIRERFPHIKVIVLSMYNESGMICKMLELGASSYLTKEAGSLEIYDTIKGCMQQWFYMTSAMQKAIATHYYFPKHERDIFSKETLSEKEKMVLELLARNTTEEEIASELNLMKRTIAAMIDRLKLKAEVNTTELLLDAAKKEKIISS